LWFKLGKVIKECGRLLEELKRGHNEEIGVENLTKTLEDTVNMRKMFSQEAVLYETKNMPKMCARFLALKRIFSEAERILSDWIEIESAGTAK
jgi:hypothetical protein